MATKHLVPLSLRKRDVPGSRGKSELALGFWVSKVSSFKGGRKLGESRAGSSFDGGKSFLENLASHLTHACDGQSFSTSRGRGREPSFQEEPPWEGTKPHEDMAAQRIKAERT